MKIIREYDNENPLRICHILQNVPYYGDTSYAETVVGIDEEYLAWFYIAPGEPLSQSSRDALALARELLRPGAWAVVQAQVEGSRSLLSNFGLQVVESYENAADDPDGISVHIVQALPLGQAGS